MVSWPDYVRRIVDGDPVSAGTVNQTIDRLIQRDAYLKMAIDLATSGRALVEFDVELDPATVVGTPVYVNASDIYTPALADIFTTGPKVGQLKSTGYLSGIVLTKSASNRGHVVLSGIIDDIDWTAITEDGVALPGHYWLSRTEAGKITPVRGGAAVYVGQLLANGSFILSRNDDVSAQDHLHHKFTLTSAPAVAAPGDLTPAVPATDGTWDISAVVDASQRGWLPANHASLGPAPAGAKFGYNIAVEPGLSDVFPPLPILAYLALLGRDNVNQDQLVVDANGIWWMLDGYDQVPWPVDYDEHGEDDDLCLFLTSLATDTAGLGVASLTPDDTSLIPIELLNAQGEPATTGDLRIRITELMEAGDSDRADGVAVKEIDGRTVHSGPVVTSLELGSTGLVATGAVNDGGKLSGRVTLSLVAAQINQFVEARTVRLVGAQEDQFREFTYLSLPPNRDTSIVYQFTVPTKGVPTTAAMRLRLTLLGRGVAALPDLVVDRRSVLPGSVEAAPPSTWSALETISGASVSGDTVKVVELTATIPVQPGSEVLVRLSRAGASDGYTSPIGVLRAVAVLEP